MICQPFMANGLWVPRREIILPPGLRNPGARIIAPERGFRPRGYIEPIQAMPAGSACVMGGPPPASGPVLPVTMWFEAALGVFKDTGATTPATADGDNVGFWADQSGNANNVVMHKIGSTDAYGTLRLNVLNGLPAVETSFTNLKNLASWQTPWNIFIVVNQVTYRDSSVVLSGGTGSTPLSENPSTPKLRTTDGTNTVNLNLTIGTFGIIECFNTASLVGIKLNGNADVTTGGGGTLTFTEFHIGVQNDSSGITNVQIAELLIYSNTTLTSGQRTQTRNYLGAKYGISV